MKDWLVTGISHFMDYDNLQYTKEGIIACNQASRVLNTGSMLVGGWELGDVLRNHTIGV